MRLQIATNLKKLQVSIATNQGFKPNRKVYIVLNEIGVASDKDGNYSTSIFIKIILTK